MPESNNQDRAKARDELLERQAFEHFCTRLGPNPTPNALFVYYVTYAREHPDDTDWIPSRSRNKIYDWHRRGDWDTKYEQRMLQQIETDRKRYEEMRARGNDNMSLLIDDAVITLKTLLNAGSEKVQLDTAKEILDRTGLISHDKLPKKDRDDPGEGKSGLPAANASQEEMTRWLQDRMRQS